MNKEKYLEFFKNSLNYYRCDEKKLGTITENIFNDFNIFKNNKDWDVYVPCGYNNIENELLKIELNNKNNNKKFIFGINGCDSIVSKNKIWQSLVDCYGREKASKLMPESYVLNNEEDMNLFKRIFDKNNIYIMKKNVQRKEGLKLTSNIDEILISKNENYKVVQKYMNNLYLINKRKVNLRIYLLIVVKNNNISFYMSNLGKCIYTNKDYNDNNFDFESNITSYNLDMSVYDKNPRNFDELFEFINKQYNDEEKSKILSNNIYNLLKDVSRCIYKNIYQSKNIENSTSFQLFGLDIIFDKNFNTYLLELNKGPDMIPRDNKDQEMKTKVQMDMFEIVGMVNKKKDDNSFFIVFENNL
tara:strand:+ start:3631 stop:4704 length:1074 start_codon:yes stop_codon:yes gene_type:complete